MLQSLSDTQREDHAEIETALHARFGDTGKKLLRQTELQARKGRVGETLTELGDAIQVLVAKAYPGVRLPTAGHGVHAVLVVANLVTSAVIVTQIHVTAGIFLLNTWLTLDLKTRRGGWCGSSRRLT